MIPLPPQTPPPTRLQRLRGLTLRWLISTLAIFVAIVIVPGIEFTGPGWQIGIIALLFGLINVALRPILMLLTCSLVVLTLGLFGLVINAALLALTAEIAGSIGLQFSISGFWPALGGGLVISLVSTALNILAGETPVRVVVRRDQP